MGWAGGGKVAYLTFDDGPGIWTPKVLNILQANGVKATFCQIGKQIGSFPDTERELVAQGHTLCNHSYSHDESLPTRSIAVMRDEVGRTQQAAESVAGVQPRYYRAPAGNFGPTGQLPAVLAQYHLRPLAWAVDSSDWRKPGVDRIVSNVLGSVSPGAIVLLHDAGGDRSQTVAALPRIIAGLRHMGYDLRALPVDPPDQD